MLSSDYITISQIVLLLIALGVVLIAKKHASRKIHPQEPPVIPSAIPYVGHLLGMLVGGSRYFKRIGHPYPIFTLPSLNTRLYIVTDPSLASSVQRATKTLSFNPIIPPVLQRVPGFDKTTTGLIEADMENGFVQQVQETVHANLAQGKYLDHLTLRACNEFLCHIKQINESMSEVDLLKWIKQLVTVSTAAFFYGADNPIEKDPRLIDQFWNFDAGIPGLLVGILPCITARKAYKGREAVVRALRTYLDSSDFEKASEITKDRVKIAQKFNVDKDNTARSDLTFFFAGIINTSLTSFWMVLHIFSKPHLLANIRTELENNVQPLSDDDTLAKLSIKKVVKSCSLLNAVFREVLRLYSDNFATRVVLSDTLLAGTYFLRRGSIVQISGGIIHADSKTWGPDVATFRPERFLGPNPTSTEAARGTSEKTKPIHPAAFRAFGGGATLCPGRHFAINEILGLVAMIVLTLDIKSAGGGSIEVPPKQDNVIPIHVLEPTMKINTLVGQRNSWRNRKIVLED